MDSNFTNDFINLSQQRFSDAELNSKFANDAAIYSRRFNANKNRFIDVANHFSNGIPPEFIACLYMRESDMDFKGHLHNGDPLTARTVNVPAGRPKADPKNGSSYTFEESAIDALIYEGFDKWTDWSVAGVIYCFEKYNGWGYLRRGKVSPYVWSGSTIYQSGKFTSDGVYNDSVVDKQMGAGMLYKYLLNNE